MLIPATPAPSPTPEGPRAQPSSPPLAFGWGSYANRGSLSRIHSHSGSGRVEHERPPTPRNALNNGVTHPRLLRPLVGASVDDMFLPPPHVANILEQLKFQRAASVPAGIKSFRPPTPSPGQHEGLSLAGYVYDFEAAQLPEGARNYALMTAHSFSPSVSYYQGPLHLCASPHTQTDTEGKAIAVPYATAFTKHGVLVCELCLEVFYNEAAAIAHDHTHLSRFYCGSCESDFNTSAARESHWSRYLGCREHHEMMAKITAEEAVHVWHTYSPAVSRDSSM